jgi:ribonucleoside-triphosphate reductase
MSTHRPSARAQILTRRTYNRPLDEAGTAFETWGQTIGRVIGHQRWLWERAQGGGLTAAQAEELDELRDLILSRRAVPAGRCLWLGGTEIARRREASQFNCAFVELRTVHDFVDAFWLLLQGTGVGFKPVTGTLAGFVRRLDVEVIRSQRASGGGRESNREAYDDQTKTWTVAIGDSAEAWAKSIGKILAHPYPARKLVLDLSEIRPAGTRLKGYGWISSGDAALSQAMTAICGILNRKAGKLLSKVDLWEVANWLGTVLSSRRSAQIGLIDHGDPEWRAVATMKPKGFDAPGSPIWHRGQSNNTVVHWEKPSPRALRDQFDMMVAHGGAEPGISNGAAARARAPWYHGGNPCYEILLAANGFCNLVDIDVAGFRDDHEGMLRATWLMARANYRQTCVNLRDGILQDAWHQTNEHLRLCGVGLTGVIRRDDLTAYDLRQVRNAATHGAYGMADELDMPRPKNVTCVKPSGTVSKCMDTTEGAHRPEGRYLVNAIAFGRHDPLLPRLVDAGYPVLDHPNDAAAVLVEFPVAWEDVGGFADVGGVAVNAEPATAQLERYRALMDHYVDQNASITVTYSPDEIGEIVEWFQRHWDSYVGVSFLLRGDHAATAEERGFAYLPQRVVTGAEYRERAAAIRPVDLGDAGDADAFDLHAAAECAGGACPVR